MIIVIIIFTVIAIPHHHYYPRHQHHHHHHLCYHYHLYYHYHYYHFIVIIFYYYYYQYYHIFNAGAPAMKSSFSASEQVSLMRTASMWSRWRTGGATSRCTATWRPRREGTPCSSPVPTAVGHLTRLLAGKKKRRRKIEPRCKRNTCWIYHWRFLLWASSTSEETAKKTLFLPSIFFKSVHNSER